MENDRPSLPRYTWEALLAFLVAWVVWQALLVLRANMSVLLDQFLPDDAFYYFQTARVFAHTGFSSFDGLHATNGYQPLWFLICAAVYRFFPDGGEAPVRILVGLGLALYCGGAYLFYRFLRHYVAWAPAMLAMIFWVAVTRRLAVNGLESALMVVLFFLLLHRYERIRAVGEALPTVRDALWAGVLCGLLFLARTDTAFIVAAVAVALLRHTALRHRNLPVSAAFSVPLGILSGGYLLLNLATTGHIMPVSGAAKRYYSDRLLHDAAAAAGGEWGPRLENLLWPLIHKSALWIPLGLVGAALCIALSYSMKSPLLRRIRGLWPFVLGAWMAYLYYALQFYGEFTRTTWYYAPQAFLAALVIALGAQTDLYRRARRLPEKAPDTAYNGIVVMLLLVFALRIGSATADAVETPPGKWNYNLYLGALWARDHLPEDATLYSGSTGILGYFSERTSVNTDGLINSYTFLEEVLKADGLEAYQRQWDYSIDAFANTALAETYPDGKFVALPDTFTQFPFADGPHTRRLAVFQMPNAE